VRIRQPLRIIVVGRVGSALAAILGGLSPGAAQEPDPPSPTVVQEPREPGPGAISTPSAAALVPGLDLPLPLDPQLTLGRLENGLTYYIRENARPQNRMELRLVVRAGSVLEDEDQRGTAHFIEHMAFNGTRHFEKQELVRFLESIGTQYGADLNAYTSFNETVYSLHVPTDSADIVERAFQILEDWAHGVSFDSTEIELERKVVIEEWRQGRGAQARLRDKQLPVLLHGSRYAERLPIGTRETLEKLAPGAVRRFYQEWYRPDLMAVVAVGDFDKSQIEALIRRHFTAVASPANARRREVFDLPGHEQTLFAVATDPEASRSSVAVHHKHDGVPDSTVGDYRRSVVELLYNNLFNTRLNELTRRADPPFLFAFSSLSTFTQTEKIYVLGAAVSEDGFARGLEALLTEATRIQRHGFTPSELGRAKDEMLRGYEKALSEREKTESGSHAGAYTAHFLEGVPVPGIEYEYELVKGLLPGIDVVEVNRLAGELMRERNRVITIDAPEKEGPRVPSEAELVAVFEKVEGGEVVAYLDSLSSEPLIPTPPQPGRITAERAIPEIGVTEWKLSNGVRMIIKPTDFKNDEILFTAYSAGGHSLVTDEEFIPAVTATAIAEEAGVGRFSLTDLQKRLAGKIVNVSPYIGELQEGFYGQASPRDLETLFQLVYLYATAVREDSSAFVGLQTRMRGVFQNRSAQPEAALEDTLQVTLSQGHFRRRPWSYATFDQMDLRKSLTVYRERFADAGDFTFVFVGAFKAEELRPLVERYLGALPSKGRRERWRDVGVRTPRGVIEKTLRRGLEDKSEVRIVFTGPFTWTRQNRVDLAAMTQALENRLRESVREELGGTYSVGVFASPERYPIEEYTVVISFTSAPDRVQELTKKVFEEIGSLQKKGPTEEDVTKIKETLRRDREERLRENRYWLSVLEFYDFHGEDPRSILKDEEFIARLTTLAIQQAARFYLDTKNYVKVVLDPGVP
jgi:zinc protease